MPEQSVFTKWRFPVFGSLLTAMSPSLLFGCFLLLSESPLSHDLKSILPKVFLINLVLGCLVSLIPAPKMTLHHADVPLVFLGPLWAFVALAIWHFPKTVEGLSPHVMAICICGAVLPFLSPIMIPLASMAHLFGAHFYRNQTA